MGILQNLASIISWVAGLWMVYKLFKAKGVLHGILGLICELYPFIWGLQHFKDPEFDVKTPMTVWLVAIGVSIVLSVIAGATAGASQPASFLQLFI